MLNILIKDYDNIAPKKEYLKDEIILAQAWKKSHTYIRRHNWYVDILELDCSIVDLEEKLKNWAGLMGDETYKPGPLRVVYAPKNQQWSFPEDENSWYPIDENGERCEQDLRPLAHMSIRDQTLATTVMLCLADAIETAQGPTDAYDFLKAQRHEVYSYGNRLHCKWIEHSNKKQQAKFSWGNSKCYRQYYEDYKEFLKRPKEVCNYYSSILDPGKELYVISLDLSKYYNSIDLKALVAELKYLYEDYYSQYNPLQEYKNDEAFWKKVGEIFNWEWSESDYSESDEVLKNAKSALGLPQGLVASGFLANAYLVRFDRIVGGFVKKIVGKNLRILDYCRYVDDIRIVVEAPKEIDLEMIKKDIHNFINSKMEEHLKKIESSEDKKIILNENKTNIISYHQLSNENNMSSVMNSLQHRISGTPDMDSLHQIISELVGLLKVSDVLEETKRKKGNLLELSRISIPHIDVRDDTLKRFSATRLVNTLREKKSMTVHSELVNDETDLSSLTAGQMLDHEFETVARKLISVWSYNPSLSLLLKCGFELFPDVNLLTPVLEALKLKLFSDSPERKSAEYVISDLLRSASISIGYHSGNVYPENLDLIAFREELAAFAKSLLNGDGEFPWYVKQQAILFLLTNNDLGFAIDKNEKELTEYRLLQEAALYKISSNPQSNFKDILATSIIAQQIHPNKKKYVSWFIELMNKMKNDDNKKSVIRTLAISRSDLFIEILTSKRIKNEKWKLLVPSYIRLSINHNRNNEFNPNLTESMSLLNVIQSKNNPFIQENALLLLTNAILDEPNSIIHLNDGKGIENLKVSCTDWGRIQDPHFNGLKIRWDLTKDKNTFNLVSPPRWIEKKFKWMYTLGSILRAAIVGGYDFTSHTFLYSEDLGKYKGIKSTVYTRQFAMINQGKGLLDDSMPVTPWLSELLYKLLQWPGITQWDETIKRWNDISSLGDLQRIIDMRINHQRNIYGKLSQTPMYTLPISSRSKDKDNKLRFAIVQPLLPQIKDFNEKDPTKWNEAFRNKHRDHLASICHLVNKQVQSTIRARKKLHEKDNDAFEGVDVIVFPELSVHPDDIPILRSLSDKTKAHIFTGLTFMQSNSHSKPINQALWLLRSEHSSGREFIHVYQGKHHMTKPEESMGISPHRPYQVIIELQGVNGDPIRLAGAICYDATDLGIAADLRGVSDVFIISALNKDIQTFDNMVSYLHYHMYQPIILANSGEFGGSTVQAPFSKHQRTIAHVHGNQQIAISIFEIDPSIFKGTSKPKVFPDIKTPPAGYKGRK